MKLFGRNSLDLGLKRLSDRLGLTSELPSDQRNHTATRCSAAATADVARSIYYAPDMDGQADPGEVVWIWVHTTGPSNPPVERAILVIGHHGDTILGLLISPNDEHKSESNWIDIGAGSWDEAGRQCWVRLDKTLEVSEHAIRRQGAVLPKRRFERIAQKLRSDFHWT